MAAKDQQKNASVSSRLRTDAVTLSYGDRIIAKKLDTAIPDKSLSVIIGANACGKSTLLRGLSRLLKPTSGDVILDGKSIHSYSSKFVARQLGLLPQNSVAPDGICVADLIARGRYPHQNFIKQWSPSDLEAVEMAMRATGVENLRDRFVDELSGGQKQRVWIAMVLAQQTQLLLLDEPTTFLDITHQIDLMELLVELNKEHGHTIVAVLHDLNQACRFATHLIAMRDGTIIAEGAPEEIVTPELIKQVFDLNCIINQDPVSKTPMVIPKGRQHHSGPK